MTDKPDVTAQSLYLTSLRPGDSLRCTQSRLRVAAEILGEKMGIVSWPSVRYTHLIAFVNILKARKLSTRTIRVYLAAVRRVIKEAYLQGGYRSRRVGSDPGGPTPASRTSPPLWSAHIRRGVRGLAEGCETPARSCLAAPAAPDWAEAVGSRKPDVGRLRRS